MNTKYRDFHVFDQILGNNPMTCLSAEEKAEIKWTPFLSFPLTKKCNFRCAYCGRGGESTASIDNEFNLERIKIIASEAIKKGIKKFRITGGEPFLHPDIEKILLYFSDLGYFTLINTNGSLVTKHEATIRALNSNIRFAVSYDTNYPEKLLTISGFRHHSDVKDGIELLAETNHLMRLNMVVSSYNIDEVFDIVDYCHILKCDLKLLDIVSVPVPYSPRSSIYQEITTLEKKLEESANQILSHEYTRAFGTPCKRYKINNVFVTVKNSRKGSHYDKLGICRNCPYFPCHEGLYDIFALSDGRLCACRWTEKQFGADMKDQLSYLINAFKRAEYVPKESNSDMPVRKDLLKV